MLNDKTPASRRQTARAAIRLRLPGVALVLPLAVLATGFGKLVPIVGGPVAGIVLGVGFAAVRRPAELADGALKPGIAWCGKFVLQFAVVLLGAQLSLRQVFEVGAESLPVMLGTLAVCLLLAWWLGRKVLKVPGNLAALIGVGTGICGASAIAAVTPVIGAVGVEVTYAVSVIFLFNIVAVVVFPLLGHLLDMGQHAFGLFAGTAVNDTSSVVAAATTFGDIAAHDAVVVKLVRTLMIIPICIVLARMVARRAERRAAANGTETSATAAAPATRVGRLLRLIPWFLIGFLVLATANTAGLLPAGVREAVPETAAFLITMALTAIGLSTDLPALRRAGHRPLLLGGALWAAVTATSLLLQAATTGLSN
jgi:uncharacterized integral membrane protein (TIGR00698 family)